MALTFEPIYAYTSCGHSDSLGTPCAKVAVGYDEIKRAGRVVERRTACAEHGGAQAARGSFMWNVRAEDIKRGDVGRTESGHMAYIVQTDAEIVTVDGGTERIVRAMVRWHDGGIEPRYWNAGTRVTMARSPL